MNGRVGKWVRLTAGLAMIFAFVAVLHVGTGNLGGETGRFIEENRAKELEVYAYVYSEVGDLEEFLDDDNGRYGKAAISEITRNLD